MTKPVIVVFSRSPLVTNGLSRILDASFDFRNCDGLQKAADRVIEENAGGLVIDFQFNMNGGHIEKYILEELQRMRPNLEIVMLTDESCPEPLERLAACNNMLHIRESVNLEEVADWLEDKLTAEPEIEPPPSGKPASKGVPHGIARRFETHSAQLKKMLLDLEVAAQHDVTILLIGETGSGKTFLSSFIHEVSPRSDVPLIPVACGALPSELIESEMFGHVKGAFTSAHADKDGKFIAAGRGTILLDEIDVLGPEQQVKLLRVIETGEFEPVGSNQTLKSQARLVVASNLDLQPLVEQGRFRPDLYYRLNMLKFEIPPLRNRKSDIPVLAKKFVEQLSEKHSVEIRQIDDDLIAALLDYPWPGNVRELENVIQRAVIYCRDGLLTVEHLPAHVIAGLAGPTNDPTVSLSGSARDRRRDLTHQIATTEQEIIEQALYKNNFSRTNTAKELGISRVTLYNKMKKYGLTK